MQSQQAQGNYPSKLCPTCRSTECDPWNHYAEDRTFHLCTECSKEVTWKFDRHSVDIWMKECTLPNEDGPEETGTYIALCYGPWWFDYGQHRVGVRQGVHTTLAYAPYAEGVSFAKTLRLLREVATEFFDMRGDPRARVQALFRHKRWVVFPSPEDAQAARRGMVVQDPQAARPISLLTVSDQGIQAIWDEERVDQTSEDQPTTLESFKEMFFRKVKRDKRRYEQAFRLAFNTNDQPMSDDSTVSIQYDRGEQHYWTFGCSPINAELTELLWWLQDCLLFRIGIRQVMRSGFTVWNSALHRVLPSATLHATVGDEVEVINMLDQPPPPAVHGTLQEARDRAFAAWLCSEEAARVEYQVALATPDTAYRGRGVSSTARALTDAQRALVAECTKQGSKFLGVSTLHL